jgi:hypothetical protein
MVLKIGFASFQTKGIPWGKYKEMHHYIIPHPAFDWPSVNVEHYLSLSDSVELRLVASLIADKSVPPAPTRTSRASARLGLSFSPRAPLQGRRSRNCSQDPAVDISHWWANQAHHGSRPRGHFTCHTATILFQILICARMCSLGLPRYAQRGHSTCHTATILRHLGF